MLLSETIVITQKPVQISHMLTQLLQLQSKCGKLVADFSFFFVAFEQIISYHKLNLS